MTESTTLLLPSTEAYLGPAEKRFFGAGYRRSTHTLVDIDLDARSDGTGTISATAAVTYPEDWSRKGTTNQPPHLGTTDVIALGEQLVALYLQVTYGLSPSDPRIETLDTIRISAGSSPIEDELRGFRVGASTVSTTYTSRPTVVCTTFDCTIANLRLIISIQHPRAEPRCTTLSMVDIAALPVPDDKSRSSLRPFATGWAGRSNIATNLTIDREALTASAEAHLIPPPRLPRPQDLAIDAFVVTLQIRQILLYELDQLARADSNTLWMRQTEIRWTSRPRTSLPIAATTRITNPRTLTRGTDRWRVADIHGVVYGVSVRCAITHRLP